MAKLDRFQPPTASDDVADCAGCDRRLHYELLNDDGFCDECAPCEVEEDGDEIATPMPKFCTAFVCHGKDHSLVKQNGFMICPWCKVSYGPV